MEKKLESKVYFELINLLEEQKNIINKQSNIIKDLLNQNAEQENIINVMMSEIET